VDGLEPGDIAFHERNFQKSNDLALIVKVEPEGEFSLELYCRCVDGTFTMSNYRSGTARISNASPVSSPLEVPVEVHQDLHIPNRPIERELDDDDSLTILREAFASSTRKAIEVLKTGKPEGTEERPAFHRGIDAGTTRNAGAGASTPPALAFGGSTAAAAAPARIPQEPSTDTPQAREPGNHEEKPEAVRIEEAKRPVAAASAPKTAATAPAPPEAVLIRPELHRAPPAPDYIPSKPKPASPPENPFAAQSRDDPPRPAFIAPTSDPTSPSRFAGQALRALPWRPLAMIFAVVAALTFGLIYLRRAHANGTLPPFLQTV
jgi:hypothetical protein